ncbi:MAG: hypothetical protein KDA44_05290 [Planctomycetales bacterium]|nr:hypothetical protein [Planctomycetales bacterium]
MDGMEFGRVEAVSITHCSWQHEAVANSESLKSMESVRRYRYTVAYAVAAIVIFAGLCVGLICRARNKAVDANNRWQIHEVWRGIRDYDETHGAVPSPIRLDESDSPISSWRFQVHPFIVAVGLDFDVDKPWDSSENEAIRHAPSIFDTIDAAGVCGGGGQLRIKAIVSNDDDTAMELGVPLRNLPPWIVLAITAPARGSHWMQPEELSLSDLTSGGSTLGDAIGVGKSQQVYFLFANGQVGAVSPETPLSDIREYLTINKASHVTAAPKFAEFMSD